MDTVNNQHYCVGDSVTPTSSGIWSSMKSWLWYILPVIFPFLLYRHLGALQHESKRKQLRGQVVLITGASSGLGEALAHVFYSAGCKVILASRRITELDRVKRTLLQSKQIGTTYPPEICQMDLTDMSSVRAQAAEAIAMHGRIDILINNAGISHRGGALHTSPEIDVHIMAVNYFGQVALTKAVLPGMVSRRRGHIVAVSSIQGLIGIPYRSAYAASKHALQGFCDSLRAEIASQGVKVTVVSPGYIRTRLSENALNGNGERYGVTDPATAAGYPPEDVAAKVLAAVTGGEQECVISSFTPRMAIFIRRFIPQLYFKIMESRARSMRDEMSGR